MDLKRSRFAPWSAAVAGAFGWALHQQLLGDVQHFRCGFQSWALGALVTVGVLALVALGVFASLAARDPARDTRAWIVRFSVLVAAVFLLPILLQAGATLLLPACVP